jgi:SPP1 family predicted phage head-tail adaptor
MIASGERRHYVTIETPLERVPDGDGGWTQTWTVLGMLYAQILPATPGNIERMRLGTVTATTTHLVRLPYLAGVTTLARVQYGMRSLSVTGVHDPDERSIELILATAEQEVLPDVPLNTGSP